MRPLLLSVLFVFVFAPAALALQADDPIVVAFTEAEGEEQVEEVPPTTVVSEGGIAPAELTPPAEESDLEDQWTAKFLAPTVAILAALGIVAAFAFYGLRVRARYRVVE